MKIELNKANKKQKIFTSADGVDIFEGDKVYGVNFGFTGTFDTFQLEIAAKESWFKFSTKEKAEEYILLNKPCLSINDLLKKNTNIPCNFSFEKLKELVKSKL
jgi:hypothetical protein